MNDSVLQVRRAMDDDLPESSLGEAIPDARLAKQAHLERGARPISYSRYSTSTPMSS